jgi:biotin carboxylase
MSLAQRRILVLGGGGVVTHVADWSDRVVAAAARHGLGLEVAGPADELERLRRNHSATVWELDATDVEAAADFAERRAGVDGAPLAAVTSFRELGVEAAAAAARRAGVPWNTPEAVAIVRHKERSRACLSAAGLPQPECRAFEEREEAARFLASAAGVWVVKPSNSLGSLGVSVVRKPEDAAVALDAVAPYAPPFLVEGFVDGEEFSIEGVFLDGEPRVVAVTQKRLAPQPYFVTLGHQIPAQIDEATRERACASVTAALKAVGLTHSVFHVEFWVTENGDIVLGEMHARPGGEWIHLLVYEAYGVDLLALAIADLARETGDGVQPSAHRGAASAVAVPERAGTLQEIRGVEDVRHDPRCLQVDVLKRPGERIGGTLTSHYDRMALVVARGPDAPAASRAAQELADQLKAVVS